MIVGTTELPLGVGSPVEDAYTARQAIRILHISGGVELEARHNEPGGRSCRTRLCKATAGHPLL